MKEKRNCKVVEDLLPNYIEKLTNEETNKFVEEHLNECTDCKKILENMKKDVDLNAPKRNEKEVKYIKKFNRKFKIIRNILLVILVIVVIFVGNTFRKYSIIKDLDKKAKGIIAKSTNYHIKLTKTEGGTVSTFEYYEKDGNRAYITKIYINGSLQHLLGYKNKDSEKYHLYIETPERKTVDLQCGGIVPDIKLNYIDFESFSPIVDFIECSRLKVKKSKTVYDGRKCYVIEENTFDMDDFKKTVRTYRDIETGLKIRVSDGNYLVTYEYEFDNVDDSIFIEPDISEYEIIEY